MLQFICKKICANDDEFPQQAKELVKALSIKDVDTAYLKTKTGELTAQVNQAKAAFKDVINSDEERDGFMEKMEAELAIVDRDIIRIQSQLLEI
jgi:hypothetical protein